MNCRRRSFHRSFFVDRMAFVSPTEERQGGNRHHRVLAFDGETRQEPVERHRISQIASAITILPRLNRMDLHPPSCRRRAQNRTMASLGLFLDSTVDSNRNLLITHNSFHIEKMCNTSIGSRMLDKMSLMTLLLDLVVDAHQFL